MLIQARKKAHAHAETKIINGFNCGELVLVGPVVAGLLPLLRVDFDGGTVVVF